MSDTVDDLVKKSFASDDTVLSDFTTVWSAAQQQVQQTDAVWPRLATAAGVMLAVGFLISTLQSTPETLSDDVMQDLLVTTQWRAPSDDLLDQITPLVGWQQPGRLGTEFMRLEEML